MAITAIGMAQDFGLRTCTADLRCLDFQIIRSDVIAISVHLISPYGFSRLFLVSCCLAKNRIFICSRLGKQFASIRRASNRDFSSHVPDWTATSFPPDIVPPRLVLCRLTSRSTHCPFNLVSSVTGTFHRTSLNTAASHPRLISCHSLSGLSCVVPLVFEESYQALFFCV